ncbi:MAG: hypothetical protein ACRDO1_13965 [Nocardioidaceae bacterium]
MAAQTAVAAHVEPARWRDALLDGVTGLFSVVVSAARLWWGHWPVLLTLALLGGAGRMGAIWAATVVSNDHHTLGIMILVLAPLCSVTAIVLMLYSLRRSLPHVASAAASVGPEDRATHRERRLVDILASVLVPFLAVYASYGFLKEDTQRFVNAAVTDEMFNNAGLIYGTDTFDVDRTAFATGWVAVAVVVGAIVFRFGLARLEGARQWVALGFVGAYVEVLWLTTLAAHFTVYKDKVWTWVEGRRGIEMFAGWWLDLMDRLGPLANPIDTATAWLFGVLGSFDAIVVIPLAWLTVGAIVFGHKLAPPPPAPARRTFRVVQRVPGPVRRWSGELLGDLRSRFTALTGGIRQLAVAGLAPMLIFGLAFLASARVEDALNLVARRLIGPQTLDTWLAFSPHVATMTRAVGLTVTMCLLGAAVDRVLKAGAVRPDTAP